MAPIDQVVFECRDHAAAGKGFTQQQSAAVAGGALAAQLDTYRAVAGGRLGRYAFTHGEWSSFNRVFSGTY